jgi:hypothetical protein
MARAENRDGDSVGGANAPPSPPGRATPNPRCGATRIQKEWAKDAAPSAAALPKFAESGFDTKGGLQSSMPLSRSKEG